MTGARVYLAKKSRKPYLIAGVFVVLLFCASVVWLVVQRKPRAVSAQIPIAGENSQVDLTKATTQPQKVLILPKKKE